MKELHELIEIKFHDSKVHPDNIRARDLAEVIKSIDDSVSSIVEKHSSGLLKEGVGISLVEISEGCACLRFDPVQPAITRPAFEYYAQAIHDENFSALPKPAKDSIETITIFSAKYNCRSELRARADDKRPLAIIYPPRFVPIQEEVYLQGETTLYGVVETIGGAKKPKAWIRLPDGDRFEVDISKKEARALGAKLYTTIGLHGLAKWEVTKKKLISFRLKEVIDYQPTSPKKAFAELSSEFGSYFDSIEDVDAFIDEQRRDGTEWT